MLQTTVCLANLGSSLPRKGFLRGDVCARQTNSFNSVNLGSGLPRTRFLKGSRGCCANWGGFLWRLGVGHRLDVTQRMHSVCNAYAPYRLLQGYRTDVGNGRCVHVLGIGGPREVGEATRVEVEVA